MYLAEKNDTSSPAMGLSQTTRGRKKVETFRKREGTRTHLVQFGVLKHDLSGSAQKRGAGPSAEEIR